MSAEKYPWILSRQMETFVYLLKKSLDRQFILLRYNRNLKVTLKVVSESMDLAFTHYIAQLYTTGINRAQVNSAPA